MDTKKRYFPQVISPSLPFKTSTPLVYNKSSAYHTQCQQKYTNHSTRSVKNGRSGRSASKLSELNNRLIQQSYMRKVKNQLKRKHTDPSYMRSSSRDSKRNPTNYQHPKQYQIYSRHSKYQPLRFQTDNQSLTSSRSSNQMLRNPIITYNNQITNLSPLSYQQQSQQFYNKYHKQQQQKIPLNKPILQHNYQSSMFQRKPVYSIHSSSQKNNDYRKIEQSVKFYNVDRMKDENFDQFLDMDFQEVKHNNNTNMGVKYIGQSQPVSPVTYSQNTQQTKRSDNNQSQFKIPKFGDSPPKIDNPQSFVSRIQKLISKTTYNDRILSVFLIGLAVLLVLIQIIK